MLLRVCNNEESLVQERLLDQDKYLNGKNQTIRIPYAHSQRLSQWESKKLQLEDKKT